MIKIGKVTKCQVQSKWLSPANQYIYYHELHFDNGDKGVCGRAKENPDDMSVGCTIEYELIGTKIKFIKSTMGHNAYNSKAKKSYKKNPDEFLGYAYSYAKDLVIAGKNTKKDIDDLQKIATTIYSHIKDLLKDDVENNGQQELL